jgi:HAD superfamily hydrolase (TIGR01509 family)
MQAVLFDFNGVLVDDEAQHCQALQEVLSDEGIALSREAYYADYLGYDDRTGFVEAFRRANRTLTTEHLNRLVEMKTKVYERLIETSLRLVAGAAQFVREAAARYRLAIVSGALRREINLVLGRTEFADRFEVIIAAEDIPRCKPDPAGYLAAFAALARQGPPGPPLAPGSCVVIEDSLPGLAAARAAGMRCVLLATSHPARVLRGRGGEGGDVPVWDSFVGHTPAELATL